ncbi:MAG: HPr family phosphocarrier protein [Gammaproteobacteria bacterium]|nr:HPr family phosphocarrier protein [Gammaproteobacteria bacterium]
MQQKQVTIINKLGLHARAAAKFVTLASSFSSEIDLSRDNQTVNGKSIMGVMMLAASRGTLLTLTTKGVDENEAITRIEELVLSKFGEEE